MVWGFGWAVGVGVCGGGWSGRLVWRLVWTFGVAVGGDVFFGLPLELRLLLSIFVVVMDLVLSEGSLSPLTSLFAVRLALLILPLIHIHRCPLPTPCGAAPTQPYLSLR